MQTTAEICVFIFDEQHRLICSSSSCICAGDCRCWFKTLTFEQDCLIGFLGLSEHTFRTKVLNSLSGRTSVLLNLPDGQLKGQQLLLTTTPLYLKGAAPMEGGARGFSLEIATLDAYYSSTIQKMSSKFHLTKAEATVLTHLMSEMTSDQIKDRMLITTPTLRTHLQRIRQKIGVKSTVSTILSSLKPENLVDHIIDIKEELPHQSVGS